MRLRLQRVHYFEVSCNHLESSSTQIPAYIAKGCSVSSNACSVWLPLIGSKQNDTRCEMWRFLLPIESKMQPLPLRVQPGSRTKKPDTSTLTKKFSVTLLNRCQVLSVLSNDLKSACLPSVHAMHCFFGKSQPLDPPAEKKSVGEGQTLSYRFVSRCTAICPTNCLQLSPFVQPFCNLGNPMPTPSNHSPTLCNPLPLYSGCPPPPPPMCIEMSRLTCGMVTRTCIQSYAPCTLHVYTHVPGYWCALGWPPTRVLGAVPHGTGCAQGVCPMHMGMATGSCMRMAVCMHRDICCHVRWDIRASAPCAVGCRVKKNQPTANRLPRHPKSPINPSAFLNKGSFASTQAGALLEG